MKYRYLLLGLLSTLAFSCTVSEIDVPDELKGYTSPKGEIFYVYIDEQTGAETKVYTDEDLHIHWNNDDRISLFNKSTYNWEYSFQGDDGATSGTITPVGDAPSGTFPALDMIYAVYPCQESTTVSTSGAVSFDIPAVQYYKENSFGLGANTMVSVTDDNKLKFKNVGGYLALKMYGANGASVKVSSIILRGNNNEVLAGPSTIEVVNDTTRVSIDASASTASKQIRLYCEEPVELGTSSKSEDCTVFWFVVPPVEFTKGFTITVATPDGQTCTQSTSKAFNIRRSNVTRLSPFPVSPSGYINATISKVTSKRYTAKSDGGTKEKTYTASYDSQTSTFTILLPTITDLSNDVAFSFEYTSGAKLLANGQEIQNGIIKAKGQETSLLVCKGDAERRYTLKLTNTGLPVVRINLEGFSLADIEGDKVEKVNGVKIDHRDWRPRADIPGSATMTIASADGKDVKVYDMQIKGRGNATWKYNKRPYALKLTSKEKVLGMKKSKHWVLLANWKDRTLLRNDAAFWLSRQSGLPYTVDGQFVELEIDGVHRGNYYLCEKIRIESNRVDINEFDASDISGGYLMEIDNNYDEPYKFLSGFYGETRNGEFTPYGLKYMFKEPDDVPEAAFTYMEDYIKDMEELIKGIPNDSNYSTDTSSVYGYRGYLDMESAIWFMFVNELTGNGDFFNTDGSSVSSEWYGPHSTYLYKDRDVVEGDKVTRSKLHMGPIWDFDYLTFISSRSQKWVGASNSNYYYYYLCKDPLFKSTMLSLWATYKDKVTSTAFSKHVSDMADYISVSEGFNTEMWGWTNTSQDQGQNGDNKKGFEEAVSMMKSAYSTKLTWMNSNLSGLNQ